MPIFLKFIISTFALITTYVVLDFIDDTGLKTFFIYLLFLEISIFSILFIKIPFSNILNVLRDIISEKSHRLKIKVSSKDDIGECAFSYNVVLDALLRRESELLNREELLKNLSRLPDILSREVETERILREVYNTAIYSLRHSAAPVEVYVWYEGEQPKFIENVKGDDFIKDELIKKRISGEIEHAGLVYLGSPVKTNGGIYGYIAARKTTDFTPTEREFFDLLTSITVSVLQRIDYIKKLEHMSVTEPLTGIYNRRYFTEILLSRLVEAKRYKRVLSVSLFDLDHFKKVNDEFGHLVGDEVLKLFARVMRDSVRGYDVPARYGGDEFILLLPETQKENAVSVTKRILERFKERGMKELFYVHEKYLSASCGIASSEEAGEISALLSVADRKLYSAKSKGGGIEV